jgi:hypothetical protein
MSSPEVAWLGSRSFTEVLNSQLPLNGFTRSTASASSSTTTTQAALGLVLLHGTWNGRNAATGYQKEKELLMSWLQQAVSKRGDQHNDETLFYAATVKIDLEDDATCSLLIEGGGDHMGSQQQGNLPIPPAELPALALVLHHHQNTISSFVTLRYVAENLVRPLSLLQTLNGVKTTLRNPKQTAISDAVQSVVKDMLLLDDSQMQVDNVSILPVEEEGSSAEEDEALRIFVAGDRSSVGKSSICLYVCL